MRHWHPHLMFFLADADRADWGAVWLRNGLTITWFAPILHRMGHYMTGSMIMRTRNRLKTGPGACALALLLAAIGSARAGDAKPAYPAMAPIAQYRVAAASEEIALSRSAAPASISGDASILTLGDHGYDTTLQGKNGFVCLVERGWASTFDDAEFWNPKRRAPICYNSAAARTILPSYLERTKWAIAGVSMADMISRTKAEVAAKRIATPEPGAVAYMMSKQGYLNDAAGHWHPHLMFFSADADVARWGADLRGSPVFSARDDLEAITTIFVLVPKWSDGTSAVMEMH